MPYTLAEAAGAVGRNRSSILRAIKAGRISATRDEATGAWLIEPGELHRVYPVADAQGDEQGDAQPRNDGAQVEIRELRARLVDKDTTIEDLRRRLDVATEQLGEALQQVRLLTDQRTEPAAPARRSWWPWRRR